MCITCNNLGKDDRQEKVISRAWPYQKPMGRVIEYLDSHEVRAILEAPYQSDIRSRLILRFLASTGVRVTEMLNVSWRDITLTPGQESVTIETLKKRKNRHQRAIPLDDPVLIQLLQKCRPENPDLEEKLFDLSRQSVTAMVKRYARRAGVEKNAYSHIFRHSFAISRLKSGLDIRTLQKLLGHGQITETEKYLQVTDYDIREATKKCPLGW